MTAYDVSTAINAGDLTVTAASRLDEVQIFAVNPKTAPDSSCEDLAGDPTEIIYSVQLGIAGISWQMRRVQGFKGTILIYEPVCVVITAHNFSALVYAKGHGTEAGLRVIDGVKDILAPQKPVKREWAGQLVCSNNIVQVINPQHLSRSCAGNIDGGKLAI